MPAAAWKADTQRVDGGAPELSLKSVNRWTAESQDSGRQPESRPARRQISENTVSEIEIPGIEPVKTVDLFDEQLTLEELRQVVAMLVDMSGHGLVRGKKTGTLWLQNKYSRRRRENRTKK